MAIDSGEDALARYEWYHGSIDRTDSETRLEAVNTFLVRTRSDGRGYVISIRHPGKVLHSLVTESASGFALQGQGVGFASISELVSYNLRRLGEPCRRPGYDTPPIPRRTTSSAAVAVAAAATAASVSTASPITEEPPPGYQQALRMESVANNQRPTVMVTGGVQPALNNSTYDGTTPSPSVVFAARYADHPPPLANVGRHGSQWPLVNDTHSSARSTPRPLPSASPSRGTGCSLCATSAGTRCAACLECSYQNLCCCEPSSVCARCWHADRMQDAIDCCCIQDDRISCWEKACDVCFLYDHETAVNRPAKQGLFYRALHVLASLVAVLLLFALMPPLMILLLSTRCCCNDEVRRLT